MQAVGIVVWTEFCVQFTPFAEVNVGGVRSQDGKKRCGVVGRMCEREAWRRWERGERKDGKEV